MSDKNFDLCWNEIKNELEQIHEDLTLTDVAPDGVRGCRVGKIKSGDGQLGLRFVSCDVRNGCDNYAACNITEIDNRVPYLFAWWNQTLLYLVVGNQGPKMLSSNNWRCFAGFGKSNTDWLGKSSELSGQERSGKGNWTHIPIELFQPLSSLSTLPELANWLKQAQTASSSGAQQQGRILVGQIDFIACRISAQNTQDEFRKQFRPIIGDLGLDYLTSDALLSDNPGFFHVLESVERHSGIEFEFRNGIVTFWKK